MPAQCQPVAARWCEQLNGEIDARQPLRHVVLQIGVKSLVAQVELDHEAGEQDIHRETIKAELPGEPLQAQIDLLLHAGCFALRDPPGKSIQRGTEIRGAAGLGVQHPVRLTQRLRQQRIHLLFRDVQSAEMRVLGLDAPQCHDMRPDHQVDAFEFREQVLGERRKVVMA